MKEVNLVEFSIEVNIERTMKGIKYKIILYQVV